MTNLPLALLDLSSIIEWINPIGNPDKLKPIASILAILLTLTRLLYYWIKIAADSSKSKKRGSLLERLSRLIKQKPWVMPAVHMLSWVVLFMFVVAIAWQVQLIATQTAKISSTVLPGARNDNIAAIEARLRALEAAQSNPPTIVQTQRASRFILVWFNHFEGNMLYKVNRTDTNRGAVRNDEFRQWCEPFIESNYTIKNRWLVAADKEFKDVPGKGRANWWTGEAYDSQPKLEQQWLDIMDDERWYVYEVVKTNP